MGARDEGSVPPRRPVGTVGLRRHDTPAGSGWSRLAAFYWVLVGIAVVGWVAVASLLSLFGLDEDWRLDRAARVVLLPLIGPATGGALSWVLMAVTPGRHWARAVKSALVANGALLGCLGTLIWVAVSAAR